MIKQLFIETVVKKNVKFQRLTNPHNFVIVCRGDTTIIIGVSVGITIGAWTNYQLGAMTESSQPPPYAIIWPTYEMIGKCS